MIEPDDDIQNLIRSGDADAGFELLWQRYRLPAVQFLASRYPTAADDEIASAVTDAFLQLFEKRTDLPDPNRPLRNQLFFVANRRLIDGLRKSSAQRRGGGAEMIPLDDPAVEHPKATTTPTQQLLDLVTVNEMRERLHGICDTLRSVHQRGLLAIISDALPDRVYLADFPDLMRERGLTPPCHATLKRSLQELRRKLAGDPVLRRLKPQN
ncbi:MAG: DNA-directed RNA polymerase specialized sigma24 family protein [Verrucomicrobiales bacterium]|jgi:DNA-directed RNA polymerase specialized sigma24 family protein